MGSPFLGATFDESSARPERGEEAKVLVRITIQLQEIGYNINFVMPEHVVRQVTAAPIIAYRVFGWWMRCWTCACLTSSGGTHGKLHDTSSTGLSGYGPADPFRDVPTGR